VQVTAEISEWYTDSVVSIALSYGLDGPGLPSWCENGRDKLTFLDVSTKNLYSDYPEFAQSLPIKSGNIAPRSVTDLHGFPTEHVLRRVQSWTHQRLFRLFRLFSLFTPYTS
jgi:hypothetical protein